MSHNIFISVRDVKVYDVFYFLGNLGKHFRFFCKKNMRSLQGSKPLSRSDINIVFFSHVITLENENSLNS